MSKNRGGSPYTHDSYADDYSDDFDDDDDETGNKRYKTRSPLNRTNRSNRGGRGRGRGGRFSQLNSSRATSENNVDNITKRVLSARRHKINQVQNQNQELLQQLKDLKEENKLLKKTQFRTDKALQKFEDRESELPQLIQRQNNEVRSLKDQIRKWREKYEKTDRYLRDAEDELDKVKAKMKKLKNLADEKDLPERSELNKKLQNSELEIEAKEVKIRELERYVQNLEKNHKHELGIERARQKDVSKQLTQLREENEKLQTTVKEKDKEIQVKNIYVNRAHKPPHRLPNSYNGTPHGTPPPRRRRPSLSEADKMTPRDRAKQMEEKRREELRKQRELKQVWEAEFNMTSHMKGDVITSQNNVTKKGDVDKKRDHDLQHDKVKREKELRRMKEEDEREEEERRRREEQERQDYERREREMNDRAQREAEDRRNREERERLKRESEDREQREREKRDREERERKQREKREREERERRERERQEQERRAAEERRRFEDDVSIQAERKKKDEILSKLREIDEGVKKPEKNEKPKSSAFNDPFFVTEGKESSQDSMASSKKSYTFTKPVENLHKGKPARKEKDNSGMMFSTGKSVNHSQSRRRDIDGIETGGYNPTFGSSKKPAGSTTATKTFSLFDDDEPKSSSTAPAKPAQKSKLMEDLFGSKENSGPKRDDDIFASPKPAKKTNLSRAGGGFPWEEDGPSKHNSSTLKTKRENSSTLFGGGSAFVNDEDIHKDVHKSQVAFNSTLPRRPKQTTTAFHSRPTVNAVDNLDDDIEEVML